MILTSTKIRQQGYLKIIVSQTTKSVKRNKKKKYKTPKSRKNQMHVKKIKWENKRGLGNSANLCELLETERFGKEFMGQLFTRPYCWHKTILNWRRNLLAQEIWNCQPAAFLTHIAHEMTVLFVQTPLEPKNWHKWFIVSYDSANKQKHHKSHRMQ